MGHFFTVFYDFSWNFVKKRLFGHFMTFWTPRVEIKTLASHSRRFLTVKMGTFPGFSRVKMSGHKRGQKPENVVTSRGESRFLTEVTRKGDPKSARFHHFMKNTENGGKWCHRR